MDDVAIDDEWMSVFEIETEDGYYDSTSVLLICEHNGCPHRGEIADIGWISLIHVVREARAHHDQYHKEI